MARSLIIILLVSVILSIQILDARHINHERFIQRWFKWRLPGLGLEVERWKGVRHHPAKRDAPDEPPISSESESGQAIADGDSHEEGIDDLSRLPAMSKESEEKAPLGIVRVPLEKSIAPPIFPPQLGAERFLEQPERLLTYIGLSKGMNEYLQSIGGVLPVIPKFPEPKIEGPLKMFLPIEEHEVKPLPPPPPPPMFVPGHFVLEEPKIKEPPFFEPVIKEPEKVEIVNVIEHEVGPPTIEIPPPPPPPHPEVVIPHVIQPEIKPILVEIPPEPQPIPAPPLPPIFKPEIKPPEVVEITHVVEEVKPPPSPPPPPGPIAIGTKWMFLFSDMILHAISEIITGARAGFAQFTTATEQ